MQSYKQYRETIKAQQEGLTPEEVVERLKSKKDDTGEPLYSHILDINNLPQQDHNWVDRGVVISCEGAGHPHHQSYKRN